jgi:hypothetical protein
MFGKPKKYISLKEAAKISGYAPDYIGSLIRNKKLAGKKVYSGVAWLTTEEAMKKYQRKISGQKLKIKIKKSFGVIYDIIPPEKIKKAAREITGFKSYKTRGAKIFALGWRLTLVIFIILFLNGIGPVEIFHKLVGVFAEEEKTVNLYSSLCEGDWQNPQNAQGQPDVEASGDFNSFSEVNSAVYKTGSLNLVCQDFKTSVDQTENNIQQPPTEQQPQTEEQQPIEEQQKNEEQGTNLENILDSGSANGGLAKTEELPANETTTPSNQETFEQNPQQEETSSAEPAAPAEDQAEPEAPIEELTSFFDKVKKFFGFQTTKAQEIPTFAELEKSQFRSAKIKLSFAIGEKKTDLEIPDNGGNSIPPESIPPIENTTSPTSFKNRIKKFFDYLFARAQEENIAPFGGESPIIDTVSPATEDAVTLEEGVSMPNVDSKIIIWYSLDGQNWDELAVINSYPLSNATNGGYFTYDAPFIKNWEDFKNLRIKLEGVIGGETSVTTYLDSVWLEVNYKEEKEDFELTALKNNWRADEAPEFEITPINQGILEKVAEKISPATEEEPYVEAVLIGSDNREIPLKVGEDFSTETHSPTKIKIFKSNEFRPGRYKLKITFSKNNKTYTLEKEFTWGVLAINVNKSIYLPGDEAYVQMAALNLEGRTLCSANLKLEIFDPAGNTTIFTTSPVNGENEIQHSGKCARDNVTDMPDYLVYYQVGKTGQYKMKLTNLDYDYEIEDYFEVRDQVSFDIERIGPTRIFPPASYEMKFKIKTNQDFTGEIVERVPASFEITDNPLIDKNNILTETNNPFRISENWGEDVKNKTKLISWQVSWQNGETYELSYNFDAPDVSPYLYLMGPLGFFETNQPLNQFNLAFAVFKETRQWQIAADATSYTQNCTMTDSTYSCKAAFTDCSSNSFCKLDGCTVGCPVAGGHSTYSSNTCTYTPNPECMCADIGSGHKECDGSSGSCSVYSGNCTYNCDPGYQDCNGTGADCETDINTSATNCGSCGYVCANVPSSDSDGGDAPYTYGCVTDYIASCSGGNCDSHSPPYCDYCNGSLNNNLYEYYNSGTGYSGHQYYGGAISYCSGGILHDCSGAPNWSLNCNLDPSDACECGLPSDCCNGSVRMYECPICTGTSCSSATACGSRSGCLSEDCSTRTSDDSDGGDVPDIAGTVTDYDGCSGGACSSTPYPDHCAGTNNNDLHETYNNGASYIEKPYTLGTSAYCASNRRYTCSAGTANCDQNPSPVGCECSTPSSCCGGTGSNYPYTGCNSCSDSSCASCPTDCTQGATCDNAGHTQICSGSSCQACASGYASCDVDSANGCEINLNTDNKNCGSCNNICGGDQVCVSGSCVSTISVSGTAHEDETSTKLTACNGSTAMIALRIGGVTYPSVSCSASDGSFTISSIPVTGLSAGTPMVLWIDGTTCNSGSGSCASTINRYSGSGNVTAMEVRRNRLMIMSDSGSVTNTNLDTYDNGNDLDITYTVTTSNLTLEDGHKLIVKSGVTYEPGGTVTTDPSASASSTDGDILIQSTATMTVTTNAIYCGGDWENQGTFTKSTGQTTTFTATALSHTITDGGSNFDTLEFNGSSGGWSFADSTTIDVNLTMTDGTLSGTSDITVSGGYVTGNGDINLTDGTFLLDGAGNFGGTNDWDFSSLTFGNGAGITATTATGSGTITVSGNLSVAVNQTLSGSKSFTVSGGGATGDGTITLTGGTFLLDGDGNFGGASNWTFYNLTFGNGADVTTTTKTGAGNVIISNVLTIAASQILDASDDTWIINGTGGTPFVKTGTLTSSTSTFRFDTGVTTTIAAATYYNLYLIDPPKQSLRDATGQAPQEKILNPKSETLNKSQIKNQSTEHIKHYVLGARPSSKNILCSGPNNQTILEEINQHLNNQTLFGEVKQYVKTNLFSLTSGTPDDSKEQTPVIKNASVEPKDVQPGQTMLVTAEIEDGSGIKEVKADMGGVETIYLELKEAHSTRTSGEPQSNSSGQGTTRKEIWQAEWLVHGTETREYTTTITATNVLGYSSQTEVKWADAANMILLWDGGAAPTGWTIISDDVGEDFYQRFPYGEATYGTKLGAATHTHTGTASTGGNTGGSCGWFMGAGSNQAQRYHTHSTSYTVSSVSNLPSYRNLKFIRYSGIPTTIPAGAIAIFDAAAPAGWTRYSSQDTYFIQGEATAGGTGGTNASHTHTVTVTLGGAQQTCGTGSSYSNWSAGHTHTSAAQTSSSVDRTPPYIDVILAKADGDTTIPSGAMIAMFDATPSGWSVLSGSGGAFYQKFIKGNSSYGATGGTASHNHSNLSWTSGSTSTEAQAAWTGTSPESCFSGHTHPIYFQSFSTESNLPPYTTVIYAKAPSVSVPTVTISAATSVTSSTATLNGNVTATGGENPTVTMYWGDNDGGTDATCPGGSWDYCGAPTSPPTQPQGAVAFSKDVSSLNPVTLYYFSAKATNSAGTDWPDASLSFTTSAPTYTLASGAFVINGYLTIGDGADAVIVTADTYDPTIDVNGDFTIKAGATFVASHLETFTVAGNWTKYDTGIFTHSNGTVTFDDANKPTTFSGSTTFYNLTCNTASKNLTFTASTTQTIAAGGTLTLNGQACSTQIVLRSSSTPTQWNINVPAPATVSYVDVKDSNATGSAITANDSKDSCVPAGSCNTNWTINGGSCFMSVSGKAYENETSDALIACDGLTTMIKLYVGGSPYGPVVCAEDGTFTISSVAVSSAGTPMVLWIDGTTCGTSGNCASTVNRYSGSGNVTGMEVRKSRLMIMSDSGNVTNTNLDTYDNGNDLDIIYTVTINATNDIELEDGYKLIVNGGVTYAPGGTVTTSPSSDHTSTDGDILIESSGVMTVGTNAVFCGGDWENQGTFTKSTGQTTTFTATALSHTITDGGSNFDTLVFNGSSGGWSFADSTTIDVNLTMTDGTLSGTNDITVSGGYVTGNGDINLTDGTFLLDGDGNFGGTNDWDFSSLTFGNGAGITATTATGSGTITVSGNLSVAVNQTLSGSKSFTVSGGGATGDGTITLTGGTFLLDGDGNFGGASNWTFYNLTFGNGADATTTTKTGAGNVIISNVLTIADSQILDASDDTWTLSGSGTPFVKTGTFTANSSTVVYSGSSPTNITSTTYNNLNIGGSGTTATYTAAGDITVSSVLTIVSSSGTNTFDASSRTITLSGTTGTPFVKTGTFTANASTIQYTGNNGGGNTNVVSTTYYNLYLNNDSETYDAAGDITVSAVFTINAGIFDAKATTLTLSGIGTPFVKTDTFAPSTSTVKYTGNGDTNITAATYNNLELSPTITDNRAYTGAGAITVDGTLNINPTASSALALTFTLGGTTSVTSSTFIQRINSATSILDTKSGNDYSFTTGSLSIQAGGTLNGRASALDSNGDVTIAASGTLTSTSENFNVGGSWANSGTFTRSSGTIIFDATTTGKTISDGGSCFYQIQFTGTNGGWTYTDGCSAGPHQVTINATNGTATFINAKTGDGSHDPTVTTSTLNVDWYLGVRVIDAATSDPVDPIEDIPDGDITISENTAPGDGGPYSTIWKYSGGWGEDPAASKTTSTDGDGNNPQPINSGAIRIREYSMTDSSTCNQANNFVGCTLYKYNLHIAWQGTYGEYDYYSDYGQNYLTSCWAGSNNACSNDTTDDDVIGDSWHRGTIGTMNDVGTVNAPPTNGSWYIGMLNGLSFSISSLPGGIDFETITPGAAPTDRTDTLTVTTSATNGYVITAWSTKEMTCSTSGICGSEKISDWSGTNSVPTTWSPGSYGFGYSTNDYALLTGTTDRFSVLKFARFSHSGSGDLVADRSSTECPCSSQKNTITYRIAASPTQRPGPYGTTVIYIVTAQY